MLGIASGNYKQIPVWYEGGYIFRSVKKQVKPVTTGNGTFELQFRPDFGINSENGPVMDDLSTMAGYDNLTYGVYVKCYDKDGNVVETKEYMVSRDLVKDVYTNNASIKLTVKTGAAEYVSYDVVLVIRVTGVNLTNSSSNGTMVKEFVINSTPINAPEYVAPTEQALPTGKDEEI